MLARRAGVGFSPGRALDTEGEREVLSLLEEHGKLPVTASGDGRWQLEKLLRIGGIETLWWRGSAGAEGRRSAADGGRRSSEQGGRRSRAAPWGKRRRRRPSHEVGGRGLALLAQAARASTPRGLEGPTRRGQPRTRREQA